MPLAPQFRDERPWRYWLVVAGLTLLGPLTWLIGALVSAAIFESDPSGRSDILRTVAILGNIVLGAIVGAWAGNIIYRHRALRRRMGVGVAVSVGIAFLLSAPMVIANVALVILFPPFTLMIFLGPWLAGFTTAQKKRRQRAYAQRANRTLRWRCWNCGYSLYGLQSSRCPECGREGQQPPFLRHYPPGA